MKADMNDIGTSVCDQISQHLLLQGGHNGVGKHKLDHSESAEEKVSLVPVDWGLRCAQKDGALGGMSEGEGAHCEALSAVIHLISWELVTERP